MALGHPGRHRSPRRHRRHRLHRLRERLLPCRRSGPSGHGAYGGRPGANARERRHRLHPAEPPSRSRALPGRQGASRGLRPAAAGPSRARLPGRAGPHTLQPGRLEHERRRWRAGAVPRGALMGADGALAGRGHGGRLRQQSRRGVGRAGAAWSLRDVRPGGKRPHGAQPERHRGRHPEPPGSGQQPGQPAGGRRGAQHRGRQPCPVRLLRGPVRRWDGDDRTRGAAPGRR